MSVPVVWENSAACQFCYATYENFESQFYETTEITDRSFFEVTMTNIKHQINKVLDS